jgi:diguanylate cyclase (GGDEF)-like protein/PAS domain S-box-containing protein
MSGDAGVAEETLTQRIQMARLIGAVRWPGVALGVVQAFTVTHPRPVFGSAGVLLAACVMAAYNIPVAFARRLPGRWVERLLFIALAGDFLVVATWMFLTANDIFSTSYAAFGLVAIEAALVYRWRGALWFSIAFAAANGVYYWLRDAAFGYPPLFSSVLYRVGIILLTAIFVGGLVAASERRRQRYQMLLQAISDLGEGLIITESGRLIYGNDAYQRISGYTLDELVKFPSLIDLAPEEHRAALAENLRERLAGGDAASQYEGQLVRKDGEIVEVETAIRPLAAESQNRLIALVRDITQRKRSEQALRESQRKEYLEARRDPLTGIANGRAWDEELERVVARSRRDGSRLTIALLELDNFRAYHDDWGHVRGDELLREITTRWHQPLGEHDLLARVGNDEFALLMPDSDVADAQRVLQRMRTESAVLYGFSAGLARWDGVESSELLMARADAALQRSKRAGTGKVTVVATPHEPVQSWSHMLPRLLARHEVRTVYQPIRRLEGLAVVGYEALARPVGFSNRASVVDLFDAAKRLGLSRELDWLCRRSAAHGATVLPPSALLFMNVSVQTLLDPLHDVDQMLLLMRWAGRDPCSVVLEVAEGDQAVDLERLRNVVTAHRDEGFRFALDDVGGGHSTLEALTFAKPDFIKISPSVTSHLDDEGSQNAIRALDSFARSSRSQLVAVGLETKAQIQEAMSLGIELGQGHGVGSPRPARQLSPVESVA